MMVMWAEHCYRLESLILLSAQWQCRLLECGWQIFFGGVFDKRVGMLFAARSPEITSGEDGNVHRRGDSKTVTKNIWEGFFKNQNQKERPEKTAEGGNFLTKVSAGISFHPLILTEKFSQCARLTLKSAFQNARMKKVSGFQPELLTFPSFLIMNESTLMMDNPDFLIGLTLPCILMADDGVKTPSDADVRTTYFDGQLLADFVKLLATFSRLVDIEVFLIKTFSLLKSKVFCSQIVCKYFNVVQKLTASVYGHLADRRFELRLEVPDKKKTLYAICKYFISSWTLLTIL
jgi:hypothetical protein